MSMQNYDLFLQKQEKLFLRKNMREKRLALSKEDHVALSTQAARHLLDLDEWRRAQTVFLYVAHRGEIDTSLLLEDAWGKGKHMYLPKCFDTSGKMEFIPCLSPDDLACGAYGIYEPVCNDCAVATFVPDLVVMPGVAFSSSGVRLGMGKGYYDRYFSPARYKASCLIGYCFQFQVVSHITNEAWDIPVQEICTEKGLKRITG